MRLPLSRVRTGDCADGAFLAYPSQEESVKEAGNANSRSGVTPSARKSEEGKALQRSPLPTDVSPTRTSHAKGRDKIVVNPHFRSTSRQYVLQFRTYCRLTVAFFRPLEWKQAATDRKAHHPDDEANQDHLHSGPRRGLRVSIEKSCASRHGRCPLQLFPWLPCRAQSAHGPLEEGPS